MTDLSAFIIGWLALGLFSLAYWLLPATGAQATSDDMPWHRNRAFWISVAMCLAVIGGALLLAAVVISPPLDRTGASQYLIWSGWAVILSAEAAGIYALGRLAPTVGLWVLWAIFVATWRGLV